MRRLCLIVMGLCVVGYATVNRAANAVRGVINLENRLTDPFASSNKIVVLIFVANECPISNRYAPELSRLAAKFRTNGVAFWLVHPDKAETVDSIRAHAQAFGLGANVLRDPNHALVERAKARITPEAAVFLKGALVYHGRIDNRYVDLGKERAAPTEHDLAAVLEALLAGKAPPKASAPAIGCYIPEGK